MSRAAFNMLSPRDRVDVVVKWGIPILDYDHRDDSRRRAASAVQARGRIHHRN